MKRSAHTCLNLCLFCCRVFFVSVLHFVYVFCIFKLSLCGPHKISVYVICINLCNLCKSYARNKKKKISCDLGLSFELSFMWSNVCFIFFSFFAFSYICALLLHEKSQINIPKFTYLLVISWKMVLKINFKIYIL